MRIVTAALSNGTELKNTLKARLQTDLRVSRLIGLSTPDGTYPQLSLAVAQKVAAGRTNRAILICGTGVGTTIVTNKVRDIHTVTAHDLVTICGSVENYDAQMLCMGQNVIVVPTAWALADIWLGLHRDTNSGYAPRVGEIDAFECGV